MSGYLLKATDGSGTYPIPKGETVIGRGPFLSIADKRISRSHAILEVVDDELRIKPVHVNPCFYQSSDKSKFVPLERNAWCCLHSGDSISLLPDKYSFQVIVEHISKEATLRNSEALDEDCALNNNITCSPIASGTKVASEEPSSPVRDKSKPTPSPPSATCNMGENEKFDNSTSAICCKDDVEQSGPVPRKRVLPSWMLLGNLPTQSLPSPVIKAGKKKRKIPERNISPIKTVQSPMEKKQTPTITLNDEESSLKKKNCDVQSEVLPGTSSGGLPRTASSHMFNAMGNEEEDMDVENCDNTPDLSPPVQTSGKTSPPAKQHKPSNSKGTSNDDLSLSPGSPQASQRRTPCMYGEKCYRKNPTHFQEFSHPGDSDYVENESQDDSDDRPECPYGTDCYRKNPQHKLEYKHTKPPAKSVLDDDSDNDGKPNEYNLEDSFIDDEEDFENTDEDSDWMPESEEKDSEDMKQLLKEAKRFVRGKR